MEKLSAKILPEDDSDFDPSIDTKLKEETESEASSQSPSPEMKLIMAKKKKKSTTIIDSKKSKHHHHHQQYKEKPAYQEQNPLQSFIGFMPYPQFQYMPLMYYPVCQTIPYPAGYPSMAYPYQPVAPPNMIPMNQPLPMRAKLNRTAANNIAERKGDKENNKPSVTIVPKKMVVEELNKAIPISTERSRSELRKSTEQNVENVDSCSGSKNVDLKSARTKCSEERNIEPQVSLTKSSKQEPKPPSSHKPAATITEETVLETKLSQTKYTEKADNLLESNTFHPASAKPAVLLNFDLNSDQAKPAPASLADAFKERRRNLVERVAKKEENKPEEVKVRTKEEILQQRKEMMKSKIKKKPNTQSMGQLLVVSETTKSSKGPKPNLLERLAAGKKPDISKENMRKLTERNYQMLPEVVKRREEEKKKQENLERIRLARMNEKVLLFIQNINNEFYVMKTTIALLL